MYPFKKITPIVAIKNVLALLHKKEMKLEIFSLLFVSSMHLRWINDKLRLYSECFVPPTPKGGINIFNAALYWNKTVTRTKSYINNQNSIPVHICKL